MVAFVPNKTLTHNKIILFLSKMWLMCEKNERWLFNKGKIEVFNNYNYLRITLSSKLIFNTHLKEKLSKEKQGMNTLWKLIM